LTIKLAADYATQNVYFVSDLGNTDRMVKAINPLTALVPYNPTSALQAQVVFASCYTKEAADYKGRAMVTVVGRDPKTPVIPKEFFAYLDTEWRDAGAWSYTNPIIQQPSNFDDTFLAACVARYLTSSKLTANPKTFLKSMLKAL
jgi:hypothetical protein